MWHRAYLLTAGAIMRFGSVSFVFTLNLTSCLTEIVITTQTFHIARAQFD